MPRPVSNSQLIRYFVAVAAPVFIAGTMGLTWPLFEHTRTAPFLIAILFSAWYAGLLPGILSTLVSIALLDFFFIQPHHSLGATNTSDVVSLLTLLGLGLLISVLSELLHRERQRAELKLQSRTRADLTAAQLAAIVESSSDSIISKDLDGLVKTYNAGAVAMFGYSADEMIGQSLIKLIPPERLDEEERIMTRIRSGERVESFDTVRIRKDGTRIEVAITVSPILDSEGHVVGASNVTSDISARRRAELARNASEARYHTIFDYAHDGILIADEESNYLDANPAICRMLGYTRDELIGLHASDIVAPAEVQHINIALDEIENKAEHYREWLLKRKDGSTFPAEVMATAMPDGKLLGVVRDITERQLAESALRESEQQLRLAVAATRLGTWQTDLPSHKRTWSVRSKEMFGLDPGAELDEDVVSRLVHPEDKARLENVVERLLGNRSPEGLHIEFRILPPNQDEPRWIESHGHAIYENGEPTRAIGTMLDITARKKAEQALAGEQKLLRTLIDMLPDYIYLKDTESRFLACNEACAQLMGQVSSSDLVGKTDAEFYSADVAKQFREDELKVLSGTPILNQEEVFIRPDGVQELLLTTKLPIKDNQGVITGLVGYGRSITAARKAEAARRAIETRLDFALKTSQIGAWELMIEDRRISKTLICDQIFGYPESQPDWSYETFLAHIVPEDREKINLGFATTAKATWNFECRIRRVDGEVRWIWAAGGHQLNAQGEPISLSGIVQDITARKEAEAEIRKLNNELEERVQQRTAELQSAVKELEAFSYSVSHDLRAPLRHINGFSQALIEDYGDKIDEEGKGYLNELRGASNHMAQLIDDVLDLARVSRSEMHHAEVNVSNLARTVFLELRKTGEDRKVIFNVAEGMIVRGDKRLLRLVLVNLLGNALKFTSKKDVAEIDFGQLNKDGETVYFVKDNGAGFDMRYVGKLFAAFQRLHTESEFEGTGIGLATIQRIVQRHGGRVWAEGVVNEGATFWFTLPG
jgi:PAS domain S-box-containing protein